MATMTEVVESTFTANRAGGQQTQLRRRFVRPLASALPAGRTRDALLAWCEHRLATGDLAESCRLSRVSGSSGDAAFEKRLAEHHTVETALVKEAKRAAEHAGSAAIQIGRIAQAERCERNDGVWLGSPAAQAILDQTFASVCRACEDYYSAS